MNKKSNFKIIFIILIIIFFSCKYNRVYHNKYSRYKIKYPAGWLAINSGHDKDKEEDFKKKLIEKNNPFKNYNNVDVAFLNPKSSPPIYEQITVTSQEKRFNVTLLDEMIPILRKQFLTILRTKFYDIKNNFADMQDFKDGKIIKFEYSCKYNNTEYYINYIIIPGKLFGTYYINGICKKENIAKFNENLYYVLNSFHKY
jgi:hypothetical protein